MGAITKQTNSQALAKILIDFLINLLNRKKKSAHSIIHLLKKFFSIKRYQKMEEIFNKL